MSMKFRMDSNDVDFIKKNFPDIFKILSCYSNNDFKYPFVVPDEVEEKVNDMITGEIIDESYLPGDEPLTPKGLKLDDLIWKMYS
ncbi:hypothetical protein C5Z26_02885 [Lactobacillus sp. CBA3606]|uniref:hypothetical protein n=1 Tax=Lactobacillus sp. CBA3606 TaxID=2099789 RepID=UPI000CFE336B|nr:hypothetical protein [Lactobacillus sp. CBA3606]AVK63132.1 hypothetical protein C5Z26_02885 [Lactobacillus sp. CBA3606]